MRHNKTLTKLFGFDPSTTTIQKEIFAGITTFMTIAYILAVNPLILSSTGMDRGAVFTATVLSAAIATLIMALYAKLPLVIAPGMGINAFFAYTLVGAMGYSWQTALAVTLIEGIVFILLSVFNIREKIINAIPLSLQRTIPVGIGLFIAFIGLKNGGIIVGDPTTLVSLGEINTSTLIAFAGIIISGILLHRRVTGALFYSIAICTIAAIAMGEVSIPQNFAPISSPSSIESTFLKYDFSQLLNIDLIIMTALLIFMDMFDTLGTLVATATQSGMIDKRGKVLKIKEALTSDAIGTTVGALLGTSTLTTSAESSAGIAEGGRSGLTAAVIGGLLILSLFLSPLFLIIPSIATTGALVSVGVFMMSSINKIDFSNISEAMPCLLLMLFMVLTFSIAEGIAIGIISYVIISLLSKEHHRITLFQYVIAIMLILRYYYFSIN